MIKVLTLFLITVSGFAFARQGDVEGYLMGELRGIETGIFTIACRYYIKSTTSKKDSFVLKSVNFYDANREYLYAKEIDVVSTDYYEKTIPKYSECNEIMLFIYNELEDPSNRNDIREK